MDPRAAARAAAQEASLWTDSGRISREGLSHMKITLLGHAGLLVETSDCRILCDPILRNECCEGINALSPKRRISNLEFDAVFISHIHLDHFDVPTLAKLDRNVEVFLPDDPRMLQILRSLGLRNVTTLGELDTVTFGGTRLLTTPSVNR